MNLQTEHIILFMLSFFSTICSLLLMLFFIYRGDLWGTPYENVFFMALSDFFLSFGAILAFSRWLLRDFPLQEGDPFCTVSFMINNFFGTSTMLWYFIIALNIFLMLRGLDTSKIKWLRAVQHVVAWGYALVTTFEPLLKNLYKPISSGYYCDIPGPRDSHGWTMYGPLLTILCFCLFLLVYTGIATCLSWHRLPIRSFAIFRRLFFMIIVFIIVWGFALYQGIVDYVYNQQKGNLQMLSVCASGLANFIVWGLGNPRICRWGLFTNQRSNGSDIGSSLLPDEKEDTDFRQQEHEASLLHQMQSIVGGNSPDGTGEYGDDVSHMGRLLPLSNSFQIPRPPSQIVEEQYTRRHST